MAASAGALLGDAIVAAIDAVGTWDPAITVTRDYTPEIDFSKMTDDATLKVKFSNELPAETTSSKHSRGKRFVDITYELLLAKKAQRSDKAAVDAVVGLYEEVDDFLFQSARALTFGSYEAHWVSSIYLPPGDNDELRTHGVCEIIGSVTYRYER